MFTILDVNKKNINKSRNIIINLKSGYSGLQYRITVISVRNYGCLCMFACDPLEIRVRR